jgi:hypothetical protein
VITGSVTNLLLNSTSCASACPSFRSRSMEYLLAPLPIPRLPMWLMSYLDGTFFFFGGFRDDFTGIVMTCFRFRRACVLGASLTNPQGKEEGEIEQPHPSAQGENSGFPGFGTRGRRHVSPPSVKFMQPFVLALPPRRRMPTPG